MSTLRESRGSIISINTILRKKPVTKITMITHPSLNSNHHQMNTEKGPLFVKKGKKKKKNKEIPS